MSSKPSSQTITNYLLRFYSGLEMVLEATDEVNFWRSRILMIIDIIKSIMVIFLSLARKPFQILFLVSLVLSTNSGVKPIS